MAPAPRSLAVLATVPGREAALARCLESLRPQVERLHVICHDVPEVPAAVLGVADTAEARPDTAGSAAKLLFAAQWQGLYLACDDDWIYPPDYVATMLRWVRRWKGKAFVTCHGRTLKRKAKGFTDVSFAKAPQQDNKGGWINYAGACALAFDTRLCVPSAVAGKNLEEAYLSVWAQRQRVPIWLVPHAGDWLTYLLSGTDLPTIWDAEKAARFANRNAVLQAVSNNGGWKVHKCP